MLRVLTMIDIRVGDCRKTLRTLESQSIQCCVTSPPYFGLRDYGHAGQIGLEPTPDAFVEQLVRVFREVRRVLRDDGTLWLNLGDSYASSPASGGAQSGLLTGGEHKRTPGVPYRRPPGLKPKDLIGIPWRVAFALQADGWYLRQDIIWHKPNPMPESVRDRCTKAHEYIFLLSKSERYHYDAAAIAVDTTRQPQSWQGDLERAKQKSVGPHARGKDGYNNQYFDEGRIWGAEGKSNKRSVWTVATQPYSGAHFATFPPDLIEPCVLAGCPSGGTVLDPFGGAGTTGLVADRLGRNAILCELNPEYAQLARNRIFDDAPLFADVTGGAT
jgi:DNA modification methylase